MDGLRLNWFIFWEWMGSVPEEQDMYSYTSPTKVKGQNVPTSMLPYATAKTSRFVVKNNKTLHQFILIYSHRVVRLWT